MTFLNAYFENPFQGAVYRNPSPAILYEHAISIGDGQITSLGALATNSGKKTGRSPKDKRVVESDESQADIWWGDVNRPISPDSFGQVRNQAIEHLQKSTRLYVIDGFAGWDPEFRIKVRIICERPYHALFMHNMLIRPTRKDLHAFGEPDYVIYNAGRSHADPSINGVTTETCVALSFEDQEMVILGTQYAGEMKKGVFTIMNYLMPKRGVLSMHCSCNEGEDDVSLFFGLSGTGKTTLSADPNRRLIGDDEHCWSDSGVFNIEGGCYAKCIDLTPEKEPEIYGAIRFGSVLENTVQNELTREVDFEDGSLTQNTRVSYPIDFIENAKIPCVGAQPQNIIFLTCDAFGVIPPVSKLSPSQAMYHFISGYTAKIAGTEQGIVEPIATFSACYGAAFLVLHPTRYAEMLAEKIKQFGAHAWLVNTGWTGGEYGAGSRINLKYTRAIIDSIHSGELEKANYSVDPFFGLSFPDECQGVPGEILNPIRTWANAENYERVAKKLAQLFRENFAKYESEASEETKTAGPIFVDAVSEA